MRSLTDAVVDRRSSTDGALFRLDACPCGAYFYSLGVTLIQPYMGLLPDILENRNSKIIGANVFGITLLEELYGLHAYSYMCMLFFFYIFLVFAFSLCVFVWKNKNKSIVDLS